MRCCQTTKKCQMSRQSSATTVRRCAYRDKLGRTDLGDCMPCSFGAAGSTYASVLGLVPHQMPKGARGMLGARNVRMADAPVRKLGCRLGPKASDVEAIFWSLSRWFEEGGFCLNIGVSGTEAEIQDCRVRSSNLGVCRWQVIDVSRGCPLQMIQRTTSSREDRIQIPTRSKIR